MRSIKLVILLLFSALLLVNECSAQRDLYNWQISPYAGFLTINNDIELPSDANTYTYGLRIERRLGESFNIGLHLAQFSFGDLNLDNASGSFLSLGYNWDNGYLFTKRATISIFHRLEAGYVERYSSFDNIDGNSGDFTFGFENGVKFRFGDRISADIALELFSTEDNLTNGDIAKNIRYNVWKLGLNYHFGKRKSNFKGPVFIPDNGIERMTAVEKVGISEILVDRDTLLNEDPSDLFAHVLFVDSVREEPRLVLTEADSLAIYMYYDSLFQQLALNDTMNIKADSAQFYQVESLPDTSASNRNLFAGDTTSVFDERVNQIVVLKDSTVTRVDTVFIERTIPAEQNVDSGADKKRSETDDDSDTDENKDAIEKEKKVEDKSSSDAAQKTGGNSVKDDESNTEALQSSIDRQNDLLKQQNKEIQQNKQEIASLGKQNTKGDSGKLLAAGAAGAVVGAVASGGKNNTPDTVYYESAASQQTIDSLRAEVAALKTQYGISQNPNTVIPIYPNQPSDSLSFLNDSLHADSTLVSRTDSLMIQANADSISGIDTLEILDASPLGVPLVEPVDSLLELNPRVSSQRADMAAEDSLQNELIPSAIANPSDTSLKGNYPVECAFGLNATKLETPELQKLEVVVQDLKSKESRTILLTGYTDKSGNADYNLQLSKKRATAVMDYFISKGISEERIETKGGGISDGAEKFHPSSRRVEVSMIDK